MQVMRRGRRYRKIREDDSVLVCSLPSGFIEATISQNYHLGRYKADDVSFGGGGGGEEKEGRVFFLLP